MCGHYSFLVNAASHVATLLVVDPKILERSSRRSFWKSVIWSRDPCFLETLLTNKSKILNLCNLLTISTLTLSLLRQSLILSVFDCFLVVEKLLQKTIIASTDTEWISVSSKKVLLVIHLRFSRFPWYSIHEVSWSAVSAIKSRRQTRESWEERLEKDMELVFCFVEQQNTLSLTLAGEVKQEHIRDGHHHLLWISRVLWLWVQTKSKHVNTDVVGQLLIRSSESGMLLPRDFK